MDRLLYVQSSPMGELSFSIRVADAFLQTLRERRPELEVDVLSLYEDDLPPFNRKAAGGKYAIMHGQDQDPEEKAAWGRVVAVIDHFKSFDTYLFAVPMWNFSIPYRLKQYIDILVQPTYTFEMTDDGYRGLLPNRKAILVYARGGDYSEPPRSDFDMQQSYMEEILGFMGITDLHSVVIQPTLEGGPDTAEKKAAEAETAARDLAQTL